MTARSRHPWVLAAGRLPPEGDLVGLEPRPRRRDGWQVARTVGEVRGPERPRLAAAASARGP